MKRSLVLLITLVSLVICCPIEGAGFGGGPAAPSPARIPEATLLALPSVEYDIWQTFGIRNDGPSQASKITLKVALIQSIEPYQDVLSWEVDAPVTYETVSDEQGNRYIQFDLLEIDTEQKVELMFRYRVRAYAHTFDLGECEGELIAGFLDPEPYIESDAKEIVELAAQLSAEKANVCERARAIYDYVANTITYSGYVADDKGALYALENKTGDCTEYTDLVVALNRSAGIPSRYVEGIAADEGEKRHSWAQVYLPGAGWVPVDATWGRWPNKRSLYFAGTTPDHVIVTQGRNPSVLNGYHYWAYHYWWDSGDKPSIVVETDWTMRPVGR